MSSSGNNDGKTGGHGSSNAASGKATSVPNPTNPSETQHSQAEKEASSSLALNPDSQQGTKKALNPLAKVFQRREYYDKEDSELSAYDRVRKELFNKQRARVEGRAKEDSEEETGY